MGLKKVSPIEILNRSLEILDREIQKLEKRSNPGDGKEADLDRQDMRRLNDYMETAIRISKQLKEITGDDDEADETARLSTDELYTKLNLLNRQREKIDANKNTE